MRTRIVEFRPPFESRGSRLLLGRIPHHRCHIRHGGAVVFALIRETSSPLADRVSCLSNLHRIATIAAIYADDNGNSFPIAPGSSPPAYESLNVLAKADSALPPMNFTCPASQRDPAEEDKDGNYELTPDTNSYAWIGELTLNTGNPIWALASDISVRDDAFGRNENHTGGMNVIYVGGNAEWIKQKDLQEGLTLPERLGNNEGENPAR